MVSVLTQEYWGRKKVRAWRKKCLCWGYHGCGCIRPRALGLEESDPKSIRRTAATPPSRKKKMVWPTTPSHRKKQLHGEEGEAGNGGLSWGRPFDWKEVFAKYKVNLCFDKWNNLEWLPKRIDRCRPPSLRSLLEDEIFAKVGAQEEIKAHSDTEIGGSERRKPWETSPDASCIRIIRSASPERLRRSTACTRIDTSLPSQNNDSDTVHIGNDLSSNTLTGTLR